MERAEEGNKGSSSRSAVAMVVCTRVCREAVSKKIFREQDTAAVSFQRYLAHSFSIRRSHLSHDDDDPRTTESLLPPPTNDVHREGIGQRVVR
jgi:hypothetical protein